MVELRRVVDKGRNRGEWVGRFGVDGGNGMWK